MSGKRLVFVIDGLSGGGTERSLIELLPHLRRAGFDSVVIPLCRRSDPETEDLLQGFDVRPLDSGGRVGRIRELRDVLRAEQPDLVHTMLFRSHITGRLAALGTSLPVLSSLVNTPYAPARYRDPNIRPWKLELLRRLDAWTSRRATTHFHAVSQAVAEAAMQALGIPPEHITVVPRGRDTVRLGEPSPQRRRHSREALGFAATDEVILQVGRQEFQKGQATLLQAAAQLRHRPRLKVLVAGRTGHATPTLEELRQNLGLGDRVRFLGHRHDVPDLLAAADVFVFPSLFEGMPGAVLEAMALELPVVASDIPPVREIVEPGRSGLLVSPSSAPALAAAIERLLDDPAYAAGLGTRGRRIFNSRFTLEHSARRMIELYRQLLDGTSHSG